VTVLWFVAIAAYGFRYSLARQSVLGDLIGERLRMPRGER
jgi:hypothetical protein